MQPAHDWVELALDYRCNLRCLGCRACEDTGESLPPSTALAILREARAAGVPNLWIGGGEPTLRPELLALVAAARKLGFSRVLLQTNGVRLAYPDYAAALVRAGVTDFSFNVKSRDAAAHDAATRVPGSHALLVSGISNVAREAVGRDVRLAADVLLARATVASLGPTVEWFAALGITRFTLWLLSAADSADPEVAREVPSFAELAGPVAAAAELAARVGVELVTLHTPPCTLRPEHRRHYLPAQKLRLLVVDPSGRSFPLESSPFEGGVFLEGCTSCTHRQTCAGLRADHLERHPGEDLRPVPGDP